MNDLILITGGAGFIGSNLSDYWLSRGKKVRILDNLARYGTDKNLSWLTRNRPGLEFMKGDIRNPQDVEKAVARAGVVVHLAAQVAVTTSVKDPRTDFDINALGTLNVLESVRKQKKPPLVIFSSTNKVYGGMEDVRISVSRGEYRYRDYPYGISESRGLDFHSPYGCSKGAADQYVRDYSRIYGIPTVVFRQSCIYGPRQFGIEDQGWVAWFIIASVFGKPLTVYGDGKQVRDVLYVDDLVRLFDLAVRKRDIASGKIYNVGGGPRNILSVWTRFGPLLSRLFGRTISVNFSGWRPGDQKVYVSDIRTVKRELGWEPKIGVEEGVTRLFEWVSKNKSLFKEFLSVI